MLRKTASGILLALLLFSIFSAIGVVGAEEPTVCAVYFTKAGCDYCLYVDSLVLTLTSEYEGRFVVVEYDISQAGNADVMRAYDATYGCGLATPLIIFSMNDLMVGDYILDNLRSRVEGYLASGNKLPLHDGSSVAFEDLNIQDLPGIPEIWSGNNPPSKVPLVLAIIANAVVDSVNPCEFAVLVILLSGVIASGERKKALKTGLAFVTAVFAMYLLMGFGITSISWVSGLSYYFHKAVGVFALIVGVFNMKSYFSESAGGVLSGVPESWRPKVQRFLDNATSVPGALVSGIVVSAFLLPCTSCPYFVTLGLLVHETPMVLAIMLLLLYNFIFILPMVGIVLAVYFGLTTTAKAAHWRHKRVGFLHLIAGILMFCMGIWMLFFY